MKVLEYIKQYVDVLVNGRYIDDVHEDIRTETEKAKDYIYGIDIELTSSSISKRIKKLPFTAYDQGGTSACGAYAAAHARRLESGMITFPLWWYRTRSNYPSKGMFIKDVLELMAYAEARVTPKDAANPLVEEYANMMELVPAWATKDKNREYFTIKPYDADAVMSAVASGHPTLITFFSTLREWDEEMIPKDNTWLSTAPVRHYVMALPNSGHSNGGYEWISVIDSSPAKGFSLRHIRKDFLEKRMYLGGGFVITKNVESSVPASLPATRCQYGDRNIFVKTLQEFLVSQGLLDKRYITSYYGNITARAVLRWQLENLNDTSVDEIMDTDGWYWGPKSISAVTKKYNNV